VSAGKQLELAEAVRRYIEPGMSVHFAFTHNRSHAAAYELARQQRGGRSLELMGTGLLDYAIVLAAAGALRSGISAFAGMTYPAPAPSPSVRELAQAPGSDPHWTNLTVTLRLLAGALGLDAIPVRSLAGTDLERGPDRARVPNPFGEGELLLAAPLRPDVAFVHAGRH
jgi:acyl CoA:acetate/3-ketoacid CoA transferase alpha subunit